jgi:hypothetical protein
MEPALASSKHTFTARVSMPLFPPVTAEAGGIEKLSYSSPVLEKNEPLKSVDATQGI